MIRSLVRLVHPFADLRAGRFGAATVLLPVSPVAAVDGEPYIHDPSTVMIHEGKFYTYGTGRGIPILISDEGWTWRPGGAVLDAVL